MRTIPHMNTYPKPLDEIITKKLLPALMQSVVADDERSLYSSLIRHCTKNEELRIWSHLLKKSLMENIIF